MRATNKTKKTIRWILLIVLLLAAAVFAGKKLTDRNTRQQTVTAETVEHADVTLSRSILVPGRKLRVTVVPEEGYRTAFVWMEAGGNVLEMTKHGENGYRTVMPDADGTVHVAVVPEGSYGIRCVCEDPDLSVLSQPDSAQAGEAVSVMLKITEGKRVRSLACSPEDLALYSVQGSHVYSFLMPEEDVTLRLSAGDQVFYDVDNTWYENYVYTAVDRGYISGLGKRTFGPEEAVTRAQAVQCLYAMAGYPDIKARDLYSDLQKDRWYGKAVTWAEQEAILTGYDDGTFRPDVPISRQQMVFALQRYASEILDQDTSERSVLTDYADADQVSDYAMAAVKWAVSRQILGGTEGGRLDPDGQVPRAQLATMLLALNYEKPADPVIWVTEEELTELMAEKPEEPAGETETETEEVPVSETLTDVEDGAWYQAGVNYAVDHGLMTPLREGEFVPKDPVTRAQAVRILYALAGEPAAEGTAAYGDLTGDEPYYPAMVWADETGLISGYANNTIRPDAVITRQQFVTMLYLYASSLGLDLGGDETLTGFDDGNEVESYARAPMAWAVQNRIVQGSHGILSPAEELTRAQVACMIHTFCLVRDGEI